VQRIFKLYASGRLGAAAIARRLAEEGAAAPARGWQPNIVLLMLANESYIGRVHWRDQTFPGLHEPLIDADTFEHAQALLKERGEDVATRASSRSHFLLSGLIRCGRCRRAYVGMSAKGNGGTYHYYACSGRQKLGRRGCDGERIPRQKLEDAVLSQLTGIYRDGGLIREAIEQAAQSGESDRKALTQERAALVKETSRTERAIERYQEAFEGGELNAVHFGERISMLRARLDALTDRDRTLATDSKRTKRARRRLTQSSRRPSRLRDRQWRARAGQGAARHPHRRASRQQPQRDSADLPRRRACGLRAEQFSGANRDRTGDLLLAKRPLPPRGSPLKGADLQGIQAAASGAEIWSDARGLSGIIADSGTSGDKCLNVDLGVVSKRAASKIFVRGPYAVSLRSLGHRCSSQGGDHTGSAC
jgi:hypothetical protein